MARRLVETPTRSLRKQAQDVVSIGFRLALCANGVFQQRRFEMAFPDTRLMLKDATSIFTSITDIAYRYEMSVRSTVVEGDEAVEACFGPQ